MFVERMTDESSANRSSLFRKDLVKNATLIVGVFALPLVLAAFAIGWTLSGLEGGAKVPAPAQPVASPAPVEEAAPPVVPEDDVPGRELDGLPRYPGSTRIEYRHERRSGLERIRAKYATEAVPDEVRAFYREAFASEGWMVADLGFSPEEWYFFVVRDEREALVKIHAVQEPLVVEIELTSPDPDAPSAGSAPPPPQPAPATPPASVGDDGQYDDGEYDDDYEGGDD